MGVWGVSLASSDTFADVYGSYYELFNREVSLEEILNWLEAQYRDVIDDADESNDYFFAISKALWETGDVPDRILRVIEEIATRRAEVERWVRLGGKPSDAEKRQQNVLKLHERISTKNPKPRKPKRVRLINSCFEKGDCIHFKDVDGYYSAAVVLSSEKETEYGLNLVLVLDYSSVVPPTVESVEGSSCMMTKDVRGKYKPWTQYCYAKDVRRLKSEYKIFGHVEIGIDYPYQAIEHSFGSWNLIPDWTRKKIDIQKDAPKMRAKKLFRKTLLGW